MKIKLFVHKGDVVEEKVNNWLSQHPNIKILNQYINNDWKEYYDADKGITLTSNFITMIIEYEEKNDN